MKKQSSFLVKSLKIFAVFFLLVSIAVAIFAYITYTKLSSELPDISVLRNVQYQIPLNIYSRDAQLIAQYGDKKRTPIEISEVPDQLIKAFLAAEDSRFFEHNGVDYRGIIRASIQLLLTGKKKQGGSTITMQVTRNFLLTREKTYTRKIKEIILALKIEQEFSKQEILQLYLNKIFLGHHAYGIAAAAQIYYGKTLEQLTLAEKTMIAGLPKAPSQYNPVTNPERALSRRNYVLDRMLELQYISEDAHAHSRDTGITATIHKQPVEVSAPYVAEMVRNYIVEQYGEEQAYSAGLKAYTTIDAKLQNAANIALNQTLHDYDERHGYRDFPIPNINTHHIDNFKQIGDTIPAVVTDIQEDHLTAELANQDLVRLSWEKIQWARKFITNNRVGPALKAISDILKLGDIIRVRQLQNGEWRLSQNPEVEGAFVSLNPESGAILALTGGFDYQHSKYNRATQSNRQPGSGFKPIIYTAALEAGYTVASIINDAPIVVDEEDHDSEWRPENFSRKFFGPTRLRTALAKSRNLISIRLLRAIGIPAVTDTAKRFGFNDNQLPNSLTLALGSGQATPLQMAQMYAVFANDGFLITPYYIDRIESSSGELLFQAEPALACAICSATELKSDSYAPRIITPEINYLMNSMLRDVIKRGTATKAKSLGRKDLAGKTGTTNEQRDAWFNGYARNNVASAWIGFDNSKLLGKRETGGKAALPMWIEFMRVALEGLPEQELIPPEGIVPVYIDPDTGLRANAEEDNGIVEYFRTEYIPTEFAEPQQQSEDTENTTVEELF